MRVDRSRTALVFMGACLVFLSAALAAQDKEPAEKHPLDGMRPGDSLDSGYLPQPLTLEGGTKAHMVKLYKGDGKDKVTLVLDPNRQIYSLFGDYTGTTTSAA